MIEYIDNRIKATAGEDICLIAKGIEASGEALDGCSLCLFDEAGNEFYHVQGILNDAELWEFYIPASITVGRSGRHWYCAYDNEHTSLCFKCPIYFV